jgi:class 3 adenylate cyclase
VASADKLETDIGTIFNAVWNIREGTVVPKTDDVALANGAVKLQAVFLYADLVHSTELQRKFDNRMVAKIVRAYLSSMSQLIKTHGGEVRSFDGDRVMGVFIGDAKNSNAAKCGLKMKYAVDKILRPKAEAKFSSLTTKLFKIRHCAGIARSEVLVVRGGVRGSNDLVFIGSAPNIAAKLSALRTTPYNTWIAHNVYSMLNDEAKYGGSPRQNMWTSATRTLAGEEWSLYKSRWHWKP